jgi:hypothetical protein
MNYTAMITASRRRSALLRVAAASLVAFTLWTCQVRRTAAIVDDPDAPAARIAESAVATFHENFNHRRYEAICQAADRNAFRGITGLTCAEFLAYVQERLGPVQESKRLQLPIVEDAPLFRPIRVGLHYTTQFERETGTERFGWRVAAERVTLISYTVAAVALSGNGRAK